MLGKRLENIASITMGQSPPGEMCNLIGDGLPLLNGPTEFGSHHPTPVQFTTDGRKIARPGDLLFCVRGSTTGRMNWADQQYAIGRGIAAIRHKKSAELQPFIRAVVESNLLSLLQAATGSTFPNVSASQLSGLTVPDLSEDTQKQIASLLGALDDKIDKNRRMNETLEATARLFFKDWFVDFGPTRAKAEGRHPYLAPELWSLFPEALDNDDKPMGWKIESIGNYMVNFDSKRVPVAGAERAMRKGIYPYHGATSVMDYIDDYLFDGIFLLIGEDGSVVQENGMAFTQYVSGKIWVNNHAHVLQGKGAVTTEQLYMYFHFESVGPYVTGAVQLKLSQGRMNLMPFMFPGDEVCRAFGNVVNPLFVQLHANVDENKTLTATRDLLLPKLMSGEILLREAEKLVEQVA